MGKVVYFIILLVIFDLLFITTGQICSGVDTCSVGSLIFNAALQIGDVPLSQLFGELIGNILNLDDSKTGVAALIGGSAVVALAFVATKSDTVLFIPITISLALLTPDLVIISSYLFQYNKVLALFIMSPIIIVYVITVVEWLKGRD